MESQSVSAQSLLLKCYERNELENLTLSDLKYTCCQYHDFNDSELSVLFESDECLPNDYMNYYWLVFILYSTIMLVALPGNIFVILTVITFKKLHSVTHFFIANMAFGDLLVVLFCIPFSVISIIFLQHWPFGKTLCIVVNYLQAVSVFVSAYALVAISMDRYMAIIYPLKPRISQCQAKVIMGAVWFLALLTTMPVAIFSELTVPIDDRRYQYLNLKICQESSPHRFLLQSYTSALMLLQYFVPLMVLLFTYGSIALKIWRSSASGNGNEHKSRDSFIARRRAFRSESKLRKSTKDYSPSKMIRMTFVVVSVYSFCWLPFNLLQVVREYMPMINNYSNMHILWFGCHWLAMTHSCYNPIILCWMNEKFRKCFLIVLLRKVAICLCCCREQLLEKASNLYPHSLDTFKTSFNTSSSSFARRNFGRSLSHDRQRGSIQSYGSHRSTVTEANIPGSIDAQETSAKEYKSFTGTREFSTTGLYKVSECPQGINLNSINRCD